MNNFFGNKTIRRYAFFALALFALMAASAPFTATADEPRLYFHAIDVGQGDSFFFILPAGETMLVDAGTSSSAKKLVSYLKGLGVKKIDTLVATHPHSDHIGGMRAVMDNFAIGEVWDSGYAHGSNLQIKFYQAIVDGKIPFGRPKRGFVREAGGVLIEVLGPVTEMKGTSSDANNNSLVLRVSYGEVSFLMTGDMEEAERRSISPFPVSTVLKAAHHGGRSGMDAKLLREVDPLAIVFSYGKNNSYGHPHKEVLQLLTRHGGIKRFDTAEGTAVFWTDGKKLTFQKDREVMTNGPKN